jgi:hypothetical protein
MIKSRSVRWAGHVAYVEEKCMQSFCKRTEGERSLLNLNVDGRVMLKWLFKNGMVGA